MRVALFVVALALASPLLAQDTRTAPANHVPPPAQLDELAWMAGTWMAEGFGGELVEVYSPPAGGQMPGHFRAVVDGRPTFYEFVLMIQRGNSIEYRVKHFAPDMVGWEERDRYIAFPFIAREGDSWYFDGYTLRRTGPDTADHIIRTRNAAGETREVVLHYRRVTR